MKNPIKNLAATVLAVTSFGPAFADGHAATGDAEAGEHQFRRQCIACHVVANADGDVLAGRSARTGPNLFAIAGRQLGVIDGFRYGDSIVELGEGGQVWTEDAFVAYVQDPTGWIRATLDNNRARGKMAYRVRNEEDAINMFAYLATFADDEVARDADSN